MSDTCPCGQPLCWSDPSHLCAACRDEALLATTRRRRPRTTAPAEDIKDAQQTGLPTTAEPDRKELSE